MAACRPDGAECPNGTARMRRGAMPDEETSRSARPSLAAGLDRPPCTVHDVALLDLDGVVYVGADAVPGVPDSLAAVRKAGMRLGFVTNNAARRPEEVAEHLTRLGVPTGLVGAVDDAVHPINVARRWARASPCAQLATIRLAEMGADPAVLGERCLHS